jgi:hypothetical protein
MTHFPLTLRRGPIRGHCSARDGELLPLPPLPAALPHPGTPIQPKAPSGSSAVRPTCALGTRRRWRKVVLRRMPFIAVRAQPVPSEPIGIRMGTFDRDPGIRPSVRQFVRYAALWEPIRTMAWPATPRVDTPENDAETEPATSLAPGRRPSCPDRLARTSSRNSCPTSDRWTLWPARGSGGGTAHPGADLSQTGVRDVPRRLSSTDRRGLLGGRSPVGSTTVRESLTVWSNVERSPAMKPGSLARFDTVTSAQIPTPSRITSTKAAA